jgi:hypothetical protein
MLIEPYIKHVGDVYRKDALAPTGTSDWYSVEHLTQRLVKSMELLDGIGACLEGVVILQNHHRQCADFPVSAVIAENWRRQCLSLRDRLTVNKKKLENRIERRNKEMKERESRGIPNEPPDP